MRKKYIFGKKLYISILTTILILLTTVATTFAWIGVFANSTFESFSIDVKSSGLEEYGILISATGEENTFSDSIDSIDIKKQILKNCGKRNVDSMSNETVDAVFATINMDQCTNAPIVSGNKLKKLGQFKTIENNIATNYFKFDIYVCATRFYESESSSNYLLDAYLNPGLITGTTKKYDLNGELFYPTSFNNPLNSLPANITPITGGDSISSVYVNSGSSCRVAFEKYQVVEKNHPEQYSSTSEPISAVIYSGDSYDYPTYNSSTNTHEFGGILPDDTNFAVQFYNILDFMHANNGVSSVSVPSSIYSIRGVESETRDKTLHSTTNHLIDSENTDEQIDLNSMMKMTVYFWFEGWDSDCFAVIDRSSVSLSISIGVANEEEF